MEDIHRGHLKIFFGYAAGVGKTYAMLKAAQTAKQRGIDVVAGYVEPHMRPQTEALLCGLEQIPNLETECNGVTLREFDLDAAIRRNPTLILLDELAHTKAEGCRHAKRYQDVEELLKAGIDVYTTVNVQHIESLNDIVAAITGIMVGERVPDEVFDNATQVELIDIEPQELLERMQSDFPRIENLIALREIALRRCADRINLLSQEARIKSGGDYHTDENILVWQKHFRVPLRLYMWKHRNFPPWMKRIKRGSGAICGLLSSSVPGLRPCMGRMCLTRLQNSQGCTVSPKS